MTPYDLEELAHTLCQHDFQGRRIFQHRFNAKWSMFENLRIAGFKCEELSRTLQKNCVFCQAAVLRLPRICNTRCLRFLPVQKVKIKVPAGRVSRPAR